MDFIFGETSLEESGDENIEKLLFAHELIEDHLLRPEKLEESNANRVSEVQGLVVNEYLPRFKLLYPKDYEIAWEKAKETRVSPDTGTWEGFSVSQKTFFILDEVVKILKDKE